MENFNFTEHHYTLAFVCSAISYAITQICKPFWKAKYKDNADKARALTKLCAVISGGLVGWSLTYAIIDLWLGCAMGAFNALIVAQIKKRIGVKDESSKST
jgi:hypothetical protein